MRIVAITQARMTSSRLPGKVLMQAAGRTLLEHHLTRLRRASRLDGVVLATTVNATDDPVAEMARQLGVPVFRGDEVDVLGRYAGAAAAHDADLILRVTCDCPLIDPLLIDRLVARWNELQLTGQPVDYLSVDVGAFPRGLDAELFTRSALDQAQRDATAPDEREHVTAHIYRNPDRFRLGIPMGFDPEDEDAASILAGLPPQRWCVDEPGDLELIRRLSEALSDDWPGFRWQDVCKVLHNHPDWSGLNRSVQQRTLHG